MSNNSNNATEVTITSYKDIAPYLASFILNIVQQKLGDYVLNNVSLEERFTSAYDLIFIITRLKDNKPYSEEVNKEKIKFVMGVNKSINLKALVADCYDEDTVTKEFESNKSLLNYRLNTEDKVQLTTAAKSYSVNILKKCCKIFTKRLDEEFTTKHNITVDSISIGPNFGLIGYSNINLDGTKGSAIYINDERLAAKMQKESKIMKKAGDASEQIRQDYFSTRGTVYQEKVQELIKPMVEIIPSFSKQLAFFARGYGVIKSDLKIKKIGEVSTDIVDTTKKE